MVLRNSLILLAVLGSLAVSSGAWGQPVRPRPAVEVDIKARLKEVEASPHQLAAVLKDGAKVAGVCANCHGDGGNSVKTDVPNLAGQNESYLMDQLRNYADGHRPTTDFKRRLIKFLNVDEKVSLVAFYARQEVITKPTADAAVAARGKSLYKRNCADCHENDGKGSEEYGRVAGQQAGYMTAALKNYRDRPTARYSKDMAESLKDMKDADIGAMVVYIGSMK
jgi:cytochrome c553